MGTRDIHRAVVMVADIRFLIYGFLDPQADPNQLLLTIKPSSIWQGELIVFVLGTRVPIRAQPKAISRALHEAAICMCVTSFACNGELK